MGAGFYVNATVDKWKNWRMYDYITKVGRVFAQETPHVAVPSPTTTVAATFRFLGAFTAVVRGGSY